MPLIETSVVISRVLLIAAVAVIIASCSLLNPKQEQTENNVQTLDTALMAELARMVEIDQIAANVPKGKYEEYSEDEWRHFQDSVFTTHQRRLATIFAERGFPGYDMVGEDGSHDFWLMVQHSDHNPAFQDSVLTAMKAEVDKANAHPADYAFLVDRVNVNTGQPQVYGTQVTYNTDSCQAIPKPPLLDSAHVNERRSEVGLEPLESYLNMMSELHFKMNRESYEKQGITAPKLYP